MDSAKYSSLAMRQDELKSTSEIQKSRAIVGFQSDSERR